MEGQKSMASVDEEKAENMPRFTLKCTTWMGWRVKNTSKYSWKCWWDEGLKKCLITDEDVDW